MFDNHIQNLHAVVDQDLKLLPRSLGFMPTGKDRTMGVVRSSGQVVTAERGQNLLAASPENRHILHEALPADAEVLRQVISKDRSVMAPHPMKNAAATGLGRIRSSALPLR
jgi:hypothetical protein